MPLKSRQFPPEIILVLLAAVVVRLSSQECWWTFCQSSSWQRKGCQPQHLYYKEQSVVCRNGDLMHHCCPIYRGYSNSLVGTSFPVPVSKTDGSYSNAIDAPASDGSGICSWYGNGDIPQGSPTASGQKFDKYAMTAAHKTLPFGAKIRVTNLKNKKSVDVTINDRGPFVPRRILDLSYAAFGAIENHDKGLMHCSFTVL